MPFTDRAKTIAINRLKKLKDQGYDPAEVIDYCINKPWQGIYEPKELGYKAVIEREKVHEAKKVALAIPRKVNKQSSDEAKVIKKEMFAIAGNMRNYSQGEALVARSRLKQLGDELIALGNDSKSMKSVIENGVGK